MPNGIIPNTLYRKDLITIKIIHLIERGRTEISTKSELEKFSIGSIISYTNHQGHLKMGGFITKFANEYFIYVAYDLTTRYRARYVNIDKMWVGDIYKVKNDIISLAPASQEITNYPVTVGGIVIHYAPNKFQMKRFVCTERYQLLIGWYNYFIKKN